MFEKLSFYVQHSLNDLRINRQRTLFALLCIAAGVAVIVALQTLAVMMADTLTGGLQEQNRSDIRLQVDEELAFRGFGDNDEAPEPAAEAVDSDVLIAQGVEDGVLVNQRIGFGGFGFDVPVLSIEGIERVREWIEVNIPGQVDITSRIAIADQAATFTGQGNGVIVTAPETGFEATQQTPVIVDPEIYPFYRTLADESGTPLRDLINAPTDIVLSRMTANALEVEVSDTVRISGANADFTVRGIVSNEAEIADPFNDALLALFGYYYLDTDALQFFNNAQPQVTSIYLRLADPAQTVEVAEALNTAFPYLQTNTTEDLRVQNEQIARELDRVVTIMGLLSLLLGSIGIINTMQVVVQRRTLEIAVLKTIGLQGSQVTLLFLTEAFIMGVIGSILGVILGTGLVFVIRGVAEGLLQQPLIFRLTLTPILNGVLVGTLVTTAFGFLPTLSAGSVRPGIVLRPTETIIPRAGRAVGLLTLAGIIVVIALITQGILRSDFGSAFIIVFSAFLAAGILYLLLSLFIWLIGRFFPTFGRADLKIALRQMLVNRSRGAVTLLALVVGVFALSTITLFAQGFTNLLDGLLNAQGAETVLVQFANAEDVAAVEAAINATDSVESYTVNRVYDVTLMGIETIDDTSITDDQLEELEVFFGNISALSLESTDQDVTFRSGRPLTAADEGEPLVVVRGAEPITEAGLQAGDRLIYRIDQGRGSEPVEVTFEIAGVTEPAVNNMTFSAAGNAFVYALSSAFPETLAPSSVSVSVAMDESEVPALRRALADVPGAFVFDLGVITNLIETLLRQFQAFPTLVGALGLIVGGVVIANSVALATMERRREIAIMKSMGLQRERVLGMLLAENALMGLVGGLIGVGIGLVVLMISLAGTGMFQAVPFGTALLLMGLCIVVALVAAMTTAWGASGEKPLTVLRYE